MRLTVKTCAALVRRIDISRHAIIVRRERCWDQHRRGYGNLPHGYSIAAARYARQRCAPVAADGTKRGVASLDDRTVGWPGGTVSGCGRAYSGIVARVESLAVPKTAHPWLVDTLAAEPSMQALWAR